MAKTIKGITVEIGGDTTKLGDALKDVSKKSKDLSGELGQINKLLKWDPGNAELLAQKQKVLADAVEATAKKLKTLKDAEEQVQQQFEKGDVSEEQVRALQREIVATEKKLKSYESAARETAEAVERLGDGSDEAQDGMEKTGKEAKSAAGKVDDFADSAKDADKAGSGLGKTLASAAKMGLAAVGAACTAAITGLVAAAESSREYRVAMGKLDTAFTQSGFTAKQAKTAYGELVGILGESDQSVEAANHLAKLTDNEKDLASWTGDILPGVFATFGDSLPIEGLTEAANETAKVGQVTGPLADALNWAGISEEKFNEQLEKCSSEQERQALITKTLANTYGKASEAYKETNAEVIRANKANDAWMQSLAGVGAAIEPVITDIKTMGANLLSSLVPGVTKIAEAFRSLMGGDMGAMGDMGAAFSGIITQLLGKLSELAPRVLQAGASLIGQLLSGIASALPNVAQKAIDVIGGFVTGLQTYLPMVLAKGGEILTNLGNGIRENLPSLVSRALDVIMRFAETIYNNAPKLISTGFDLLKNLVQGVMNSLPTLLSKAPAIISKFANVINDNFPTILAKGVQLILEIVKGIIKAIPTLVKNIPKIITAIVDVWEAFNWLALGKKAITLLKNGITSMLGAIKGAGKSIMDGCVNAMRNLPQSLGNLGKQAMSGMGNALRAGLSNIKTAAKTIFDGCVNVFKGLPSKLLSVGKDLVRGLWNGISDMTGWVINKIKGFGSKVLTGLKNFFGIHSPSTETAWIGEMLDRGLAEGVLANANMPIKAMDALSGDMLDAATNGVDGLTLQRSLTTSRSAAAAAPVAATTTISSPDILAKLDGIYERLNRMQIVLDTGTLVGEAIEKIDAGLATRQRLTARGV